MKFQSPSLVILITIATIITPSKTWANPTPCPPQPYENSTSEDPQGIPYLNGPCHTPGGPSGTHGRNLVIATWVINDSTWGAAGLQSETPIVVRNTWLQQVILSQVLAATKSGMLSRFRARNGRFVEPSYKLSRREMECLYGEGAEVLDHYRAVAHVTAMKDWVEENFPEEVWGSASYTNRVQFYEQLKCTGAECRTVGIFEALGLVDSFVVDTEEEDTTTFAACTRTSPQEIGHHVGKELNEYSKRDGWNAYPTVYGSYGPQAFKDPTGYYSVHPPGMKMNQHRWQPILENDGRGFYTFQDHVVPHIGLTADTNYLSKLDREQLRQEYMMEPYTEEQYIEMATASLDRTASFADDEKEKTIIAWFDDKLNLVATTFAQIAFPKEWKLEDVAYYLQGYIMLEYDGVVANWRSKVENDHVRPTTVVKEYLSGEVTNNWQRGVNGVTTYPTEEWTPYIRVMPHGEFPSGSSCICTVVMKWSAEALRVDYDGEFHLSYDHPVGSNVFEPTLPTQAFQSSYASLKEVAEKCASTRVDGGMHFPASVVAGDAMCGGELVFDKGVAFQKFIWTGDESYLDSWGGVDAFGHVHEKENCKYNPFPNSNGGAIPSKFECIE